MILFIIFICILVIYFITRQYTLYRTLQKCGLHPQFDIFGWTGSTWLDKSDAHVEFTKKCQELGTNTFSLLRGSRPVVVVSDVDLIHSISTQNYDCFHSRTPEVFDDDPITSESVHMFAARGERWKRLRTLTSYGLSTTKLKLLFPRIDQCVDGFLEHVQSINNFSSGDRIFVDNSHRLFQNHTSFVMVQCIYGYFGKDFSYNKNTFLQHLLNAFGALSDNKNGALERVSDFLPELKIVFKEISKLFKNTGRQNFLEHLYCLLSVFYLDMNVNNKPFSLLKFLYVHRDGKMSKVEKGYGKIEMKHVRVETRISNQEIFAQCKFLSVAGFDTTANTLTLLFNFLAIFPEIQEQLYNSEVKDQIEPLSYDSLREKVFLQNCIFETLRLYPHASPLQQRICTAKCTINEKYTFQPGFEIILNPWVAHHNKTIWGDDVEIFRPSRFDNLSEEQKRAFMPFGVGPRQCVGMRFALMELKTTVFRVLQNYSIHPSLNTKLNVTMTARDTGTIWPESGLELVLKKRNIHF